MFHHRFANATQTWRCKSDPLKMRNKKNKINDTRVPLVLSNIPACFWQWIWQLHYNSSRSKLHSCIIENWEILCKRSPMWWFVAMYFEPYNLLIKNTSRCFSVSFNRNIPKISLKFQIDQLDRLKFGCRDISHARNGAVAESSTRDLQNLFFGSQPTLICGILPTTKQQLLEPSRYHRRITNKFRRAMKTQLKTHQQNTNMSLTWCKWSKALCTV